MDIEPDTLAELCFTRTPADLVPRDIVLAALWHLYVKAAGLGLETRADRTFRHTLLGQRSGLDKTLYRQALRQLQSEGLIFKERNGYGLTRRGFAAVRAIVDVDKSLDVAREAA